MAYSDMTYEYLLKRMIDRVTTDYPNLDKREGSIIFNALASGAMELAILYTELDNVLRESFVETASREYLLLGCEQMGIDILQFEPTHSVHKAQFNVLVGLGSRWNCDVHNYIITDYLGMENGYYTYRIMCETPGSEPNTLIGDLTPIDGVSSDLNHAKLIECLIEGEEEKTDDEIREAYFNNINRDSFDGNVNQYKKWCEEYVGVGNYKIFPLWNGNNTVKVSILSSSNRIATEELIEEFQDYLDPGITGMGDGAAPIGSFVTVTTASESKINVACNVKLESGYTDTSVITDAIEQYFASISYVKNTVSYMNLGAVILAATGVDSISNLTINGGTSDIDLGDEVIPVVGTTEWTVV